MYLFYLWVLKILKHNLTVKIKLVRKGIMQKRKKRNIYEQKFWHFIIFAKITRR